ncbi:uncharacterized protein LOC125244668 [Megalobrama amblycephala]|uniref:uncharacterized protein LOC125244668 n=1 Tax=Megalobrama amblycephala TaxID=75352 RepID=UPI002013C78C|nr:uncharacterized protein LOC125244668 [Megalobrama amblycephala]
MADQCDLCLLGVIIVSSLITGTSGVNVTHVFISSGENVHLPCNNALSDYKSTTWTYYNRYRHSAAVELITGGIKKKDTERHERLSLWSDCSLNIKNVTEEDHGLYICQQYVNGGKQGPDAHVFLHVLHVSPSSSSQTEISPGRSVTLSCQLYSYTGSPCGDLVRHKGLQLLWVNQTGVDLKTDSRYQISSDHCMITLSTTLLNEDDNREWRCQLTLRNQLQTSVRYTVKYSAQDVYESTVRVTVISVAAVAVFLLAVLWLIRRKTAGNKRGTADSAVKDENEHKGTYETIDMSTPPAARANEQTDDHVTYSEVTSSNKKPVKSFSDHNDTVTYAAIRGAEDEPQDELYSL